MSKIPLSRMIDALENVRWQLGGVVPDAEPADPEAYQKAIDSLRWMERNGHALAAAVAIVKNDAVKAVLDTWPDAHIAAVRDRDPGEEG
jgi:hypothetical protein